MAQNTLQLLEGKKLNLLTFYLLSSKFQHKHLSKSIAFKCVLYPSKSTVYEKCCENDDMGNIQPKKQLLNLFHSPIYVKKWTLWLVCKQFLFELVKPAPQCEQLLFSAYFPHFCTAKMTVTLAAVHSLMLELVVEHELEHR